MSGLIRKRSQSRQRGSATLTALIVMVLATIILSSLIWQQHLSIRQLEYQRDRRQAEWLHIAATDFARFVLAEDSRATAIDHLGEPWAIPLADTKIADFLRGVDIPQEIRHVSLIGQVTDAQSRFNLNSLIDANGITNAQALAVFQRLLENFGIDRSLAQPVATYLAKSGFRFKDVNELSGLTGFTESTLRRLKPALIALPESTFINVNTANADVLRALFQGMSTSQANAFISGRLENPLKSHLDVRNLLTRVGVTQAGENALMDTKSGFFITRSEVRFGEALYVGQSVLRRKATSSSASAATDSTNSLTQIISTRFYSTLKE
jgi:general secretion pathway protein K